MKDLILKRFRKMNKSKVMTKQIVAHGEMSNLVGMYAAIKLDGKFIQMAYIYGKAGKYYVVQAINAITGTPNIAKLVKPKKMLEWVFFNSSELATEWLKQYHEVGYDIFDLCV